MYIDINTDAVVKFTAKLERMSKSALPVAVRSALNSAAYDVKVKTMPQAARDKFIQRKPTFFKANSKVEQAKGFDISKMAATVGFVSKGGNDKAVDDLEQQEKGGAIGGRSFIPLKEARTSNNWNKNVRRDSRISEVGKKLVDSRKEKGKTVREKWNKAAIKAGVGGFVVGNRKKSRGKIVYKVTAIQQHAIRNGTYTFIKVKPAFSLSKGRKVTAKPTHFMEDASKKSSNKLEQFYIEQAKKQIDKL